MPPPRYQDLNARTIDSWVANGWEWGVPIAPAAFAAAKGGEWGVLLTPKKPVPRAWFAPFLQNGRLKGAKLLGLASGGGQQMPVFAALGADCTVLDYSEKQLASERLVAAREGYAINVLRADMTERLPFADGAFDIIFHPVSNCYIEDVRHVWRECARVLKPGGVLLAGFDTGVNYLFDDDEDDDPAKPLTVVNKLPFNPLKDPALMEKLLAHEDGVQFSHTLEEQIGGQLQAGLTLTDLFEDADDRGIGRYCPNYAATRSVKP